MNNNGVRLQNLRDFTVQIRHTTTDQTVGTGVVVSTGGKILTCAHVIVAAGVNPRPSRDVPNTWALIVEKILGQKNDGWADDNQAQVGVYFPQVRGQERKSYRANVVACCAEHDDDIVLLQLLDGPAPLGPEQIAAVGTAELSEGHPFRSYGYSPLGQFPAARADGKIMGSVEPPRDEVLQIDPIQLQSRQIAKGMSGAAVLDEARNLVVGLVAARWYPPGNSPIQDDVGWGVDCEILKFDTFNTFGIPLADQPLPKRPARQPSEVEQAAAQQTTQLSFPLDPKFHNAPPSLGDDWAGRTEVLQAITSDWADPARRVTGLIGFGGEGKSSLARRWLGDVLNQRLAGCGLCPQPDGVFWWGFYESRSVDVFFEAALTYLGGADLVKEYTSATVRAGVITALLKERRFIFVLDGLEVMQHQDDDSYGLLKSNDLRDFLNYFAGTDHSSFCLITSRAPLLDLLDYPGYTHHDVDRLDEADARALLRNLGVTGSDEALDTLTRTWDGHALTLSLLGSDIVERYGGELSQATDLPSPDFNESRYARVARVLRRYDDHLTTAERAFLTIFSAFRLPVHESALETVFQTKSKKSGFLSGLFGKKSDTTDSTSLLAPLPSSLDSLLSRLTTYRLLRYNAHEHTYTTHPLIRNHYEEQLAQADPAEQQAIHRRIKSHYLAQAGDDTPRFPTLDDLTPLIEAVHHACQAGEFDEAYNDFVQARIYQGWPARVLVNQLGAWETALTLMIEFFPNGDTTQEPQVSKPANRSWILNETGLCLMNLGRLADAVPFYERGNTMAAELKDWRNASLGYQNLAGLHIYLGNLATGADTAREALALARRTEKNQNMIIFSLSYQAWVDHLRGEVETAGDAFRQAEALERESNSTVLYLYSLRGIQHADHLRRTGNQAYARQITVANLEICERNRFTNRLSLCHCVMGDLETDTDQHESAQRHYDKALEIARGMSYYPALIEALLARGRWAAKQRQAKPAFNDLDEALGYAVDGGYRLYEADIRNALAWAHLAAGNSASARAEATRARRMSEEMGYYWGQVDADEVLAAIREE